MALFRVFKETALPGTLTADAVYYITDTNASYVQMYVTSSAGVARRIPTNADITTLISTMMANSSRTQIVADITARNALTGLTVGNTAYVSNAVGDPSVASGAAAYIVVSTGPVVWQKTNEYESMDLALTWAAITGKPTSSPASIDSAVTNSHTHTNKTQLDLIGDSGGQATYNGAIIKTEWSTLGW